MTTTIDRAGYEVWFKAGRAADPKRLLSELSKVSDAPPYVPESRTKLEGLSLALSDCYQSNLHGDVSYVVRPLASRQGREVWLELKGDSGNTLKSEFYIRVPDSDTLIPEGSNKPDPHQHSRIQDLYNMYMETIGSKAVKTILVKEIQRLGGVRIDGKDAYFLPPESYPEWSKVADAAIYANVSNDIRFYSQKYELNGSALDAVKIAIEEEITGSVDSILDELSRGQFTDRVTSNRLESLSLLAKKMKRYENLFNEGLQACSYKIKDVVAAMTMTTAATDDDVFDTAI